MLKQIYKRIESDGEVYIAVGNGSEELELTSTYRLGGAALYHLKDNDLIPKGLGRGRQVFYFLKESDFHKFNALGVIEKLNENKGEKWEIVDKLHSTHHWNGETFSMHGSTRPNVTIFARLIKIETEKPYTMRSFPEWVTRIREKDEGLPYTFDTERGGLRVFNKFVPWEQIAKHWEIYGVNEGWKAGYEI